LRFEVAGKLCNKNQGFRFEKPQTSNLELQTFSIVPFRWENLCFLHR